MERYIFMFAELVFPLESLDKRRIQERGKKRQKDHFKKEWQKLWEELGWSKFSCLETDLLLSCAHWLQSPVRKSTLVAGHHLLSV